MRVITSDTPSERSEDENNERYKIGIHLYFPDIFVDAATHLKLRSYLLVKAMAASDDHIGMLDGDEGCLLVKPWTDVLDSAVCVNAQLRMICSRKAVKCKHSKEERKEMGCTKSHDKGRLYRVVEVAQHDGTHIVRDDALFRDYAAATHFVEDDNVNLVSMLVSSSS